MKGTSARQRVLVTAGGSGIGRAIAERFAAAGALVAICDVSESVLAEFRSEREEILAFHADVSRPGDVRAFVDSAVNRLGGVDVLVNNAGIGGPRAALEAISTDEWDRTIAVNLSGAFYCMRAVIPRMQSQRSGCIINISTTSARTGLPNRSPYVASKVGLLGLTYNAARELGPYNIRCNAILPGYIDNPRGHKLIEKHADETGKSLEESRREFMSYISMRTMITMEEIGDMAVFLASDAARHVSGQQIGVCGNLEYEV